MTTWNLDLSNQNNFTQQNGNTAITNSTISLSKLSAMSAWSASAIPQGYTGQLGELAYGNGTCVAAAGTVALVSSNEGITWSIVTLPNGIYGNQTIAYGNGTFVIIPYNSNQVATSTDNGASWTLRTTMPSIATWKRVRYVNGQFLAVAIGSNKAAVSNDGITWTAKTLPLSLYWSDITYGNGLYVVTSTTANNNTFLTSSDCTTWNQKTLPSLPTNSSWTTIQYGNGIFMAMGKDNSNSSRIVISTSSNDGTTWSALSNMPSPGTNTTGYTLNYANGIFLITGLGTYSNVRPLAFSSADNGATWDLALMPLAMGMNAPYGVVYGAESFISSTFNFVPAVSLAYSYSTVPSYVVTAAASDFTTTTGNKIDTATITETKPTNTTVKTLVSFDGRTTWKYWSGSAWNTTSLANIETDGMTATAMNSALTGYVFGANDTALDIAFSLHTTDNTKTPVVSGMSLTYSSANRAPVAPMISDITKYNLRTTIQLPTFSDPDGNTLTYSVSGLPTGLSFNPTRRLISGLSATTGQFSVTMNANDGQGGSTNQGFLLTLNKVKSTTIMEEHYGSEHN